MLLDFKPNIGLIPFLIGVNIKEIESILGKEYSVKESVFFSGSKRIIYEKKGLTFDVDSDHRVAAIETISTNSVNFKGINFFSYEKAKLETLLRNNDANLILKDGFTSLLLGISVFFAPKKNKASSLIAFKKGYFVRQSDINPINKINPATIDELFTLLK